MYRTIAFSFFGLTLLVVGLVVWMFSVRATVRVQVARDPVSVETSVDIAKSPEQGQLQGRVVAGTFDNIKEYPVKERAGDLPPVVATTTGRVRITNRYSKEQPLIRTTRLLTSDGKLFRIDATVTVPSGGSVEVNAYSDAPGNGMLIKAGTAFTIPGLWIDLQKHITAEALTDFSGATVAGGKVVTAEEIAEAQEELELLLLEQAKATLAAEAGLTSAMLDPACGDGQACWGVAYRTEPLEKRSNATPGQTTDSFLVQAKIRLSAAYFPRTDMESLVRTKLKERLPEGRDLVEFDRERVTYRLETSDESMETARIAVTADAKSRLTSKSGALTGESLAGMSVEAAQQKLSSVEGVEFVEITLRPSWARKLPGQKDRIEVVIE
ncbi:hypothetical protein L0Y59_00570 [Candidatus Uhrbacteria bacterium]|nr:hypothetical protein [Candidatus Uhrbacteria bacterium]